MRLRTERLVLRLGSRDELVELAQVAEQGVHPPEEMPFSVAWTDAIGQPDFVDTFVAYHERILAAWSPAEWMLNLLVWADGELAGSQSLGAHDFARTGAVYTGSWLGRPFQRRGVGTEMRSAVLELAFHGLGATRATSAWLEGNLASARVSEKLGYRDVGLGEQAPRGEPVVTHRMRLDAPEWRCPLEVEIEGLAECRPLFGCDP